MKVLYLVSLFPCWSETFIVRELHALKKLGIKLEIYSLKPHSEDMVHDDAKALLENTRYPSNALVLMLHAILMFIRRPLVNVGILLAIIRRLVKHPEALLKSLITVVIGLDAAYTLKNNPPERLHAHWATYPSTAAWVISKNLDIPFGFTCHAHDIFLENHLLTEKVRDASLCVTISDFNIRFIGSLIGKHTEGKFNVVHCGVDIDTFQMVEAEKDNLIVTVGRFDEIKGFKYLIEACSILRDRSVDFRCEIVGEGPLRSDIESEIAQLDLGQVVKLLGVKNQEEVRQFIGNGTVFCLPSIKTEQGNMDGIPVVLMEAMALGTAVVSTKVSGIPELVVAEQTGLLCESRDSAALADSLEEILKNNALRERLVKAARQKVQQGFDCNIEAEKLANLFRQSS